MNRNSLLVAASLGLAVCAAGCQNSGKEESQADATRPQMTDTTAATAAPAAAVPAAAVSTTAFTVPYAATGEAPWMRTSSDTTAAGTLRTGDVVYLRSDAPTTGIVAARTADNQIVYIRAADLRKQ